jgi:hypothetical protein
MLSQLFGLDMIAAVVAGGTYRRVSDVNCLAAVQRDGRISAAGKSLRNSSTTATGTSTPK